MKLLSSDSSDIICWQQDAKGSLRHFTKQDMLGSGFIKYCALPWCVTLKWTVSMSHTIPRTQPQTAEQQILTTKSYILIIFKQPLPKILGTICLYHFRITWHVNIIDEFQVNCHGISSLARRSIRSYFRLVCLLLNRWFFNRKSSTWSTD